MDNEPLNDGAPVADALPNPSGNWLNRSGWCCSLPWRAFSSPSSIRWKGR